MYEAGKIDYQRTEECIEYIMSDENHRKIRNLIAMILLPKTLHKNEESQTAYLRAAVSRVSLVSFFPFHKLLLVSKKNKFHRLSFRLRIRQFLRNLAL